MGWVKQIPSLLLAETADVGLVLHPKLRAVVSLLLLFRHGFLYPWAHKQVLGGKQ
jgi:hypothetical protein